MGRFDPTISGFVLYPFPLHYGLPRWLSRRESASNAGDAGDVDSILGQEDILEEEMSTHSSTLA